MQMGTTHCVTLSGARKRAVERVSVGPAELKNKTISIKVELNQHTFTRSEAFARVFEEFQIVKQKTPKRQKSEQDKAQQLSRKHLNGRKTSRARLGKWDWAGAYQNVRDRPSPLDRNAAMRRFYTI